MTCSSGGSEGVLTRWQDTEAVGRCRSDERPSRRENPVPGQAFQLGERRSRVRPLLGTLGRSWAAEGWDKGWRPPETGLIQ